MLRWRKFKINDILNEFLILNEYEIFQEKFIVLQEQFIYQLVLLQNLNHKMFESRNNKIELVLLIYNILL